MLSLRTPINNHFPITWFNLTPKIMPLYIGEDRVPDIWTAILMGYLPWTLCTFIILWRIASPMRG